MNRADASNALIVMARLPQKGRVKSRLAATLGSDAATEFYRLSAQRLFQESARLSNVRRYLFFADSTDEDPVRAWVGPGFHVEPQVEGDFGQRLAHAFETVFAQGAQKAVVVGSDIPDLSATVVDQALRLLDHYPLVIGPDHAGGYYLMGMKMLYTDLFRRRLAWGTNRVYGHTLRIMQGLELVPAFLPTLIDVDTEGDLRRWLEIGRRRQQDALERFVRQLFEAG